MSSAGEDLAAKTGRTILEADQAIAEISTRVRTLVSAGLIVRKDRQAGMPTTEEIADDLATASAFVGVRDEIAAERAGARGAIYASGRAPEPPIPGFRARRGLR